MGKKKFDFGGYATKNDLVCSDGRTIRKDAFKENDGRTVPLVWQHLHDDPTNILGHALLENRPDGVYAYGLFNNSDMAAGAKELVEHGDITCLSIYANKLVEQGKNVLHGAIKEVSLVLAGANQGALIDSLALEHSDGSFTSSEEEAIIYTDDETVLSLSDVEYSDPVVEPVIEDIVHTDSDIVEPVTPEIIKPVIEDIVHADTVVLTPIEIFDSLTDEQKNVVFFMLAQAVEDAKSEDTLAAGDSDETTIAAGDSDDTVIVLDSDTIDPETVITLEETTIETSVTVEEDTTDTEEETEDTTDTEEETKEIKHSEGGQFIMKKNVFDKVTDTEEAEGTTLTHDDMTAIFADAKKCGSLKEAFFQHGITGLDVLFPEARMVTPTPDTVMRNVAWVESVWADLKKSPFSRIKSSSADLTADEARAKGYTKGNLKVEEVFGLLKRITTPVTVYKKQKLDRDDIIDIVDMDVVAWLKAEMRVMLNEELARAVLVGDGRSVASEDKIPEANIRPIFTDSSVYTIRQLVTYPANPTNTDKALALVEAALRSRKTYKGSGTPSLYVDPDSLTTMLLAVDTTGRRLYNSEAELALALRVKAIVEVPIMETQTRVVVDGGVTTTYGLIGLIVNLNDYTIGADKGGAVNMFDDFDIDYNRFKYLIETRCSGALTKPYSAIALETVVANG